MMTLNIDRMSSIPENSNPYHHDAYHMGREIGTDLMMMFENHPSEEMNYFILVNTRTGERLKVRISDEEIKHGDVQELKKLALNYSNPIRWAMLSLASEAETLRSIVVAQREPLIHVRDFLRLEEKWEAAHILDSVLEKGMGLSREK